jgi:voltage-gated potassium channel
VETYVRGEMPDLLLGEFAVQEGSSLAHRRLEESGLRSDWNILVVAVRKRGVRTLIIPRGETLLEEGDRLVAIGRPETLRKLVRGERQGNG